MSVAGVDLLRGLGVYGLGEEQLYGRELSVSAWNAGESINSARGLMISFRVNSHRFQFRAAAIVLDDGKLLLHRLQGDPFWALPGGRVEAGESAADAISREFQEELGLAVECQQLACTGENFFEYASEAHHEIGLYFYVALPEDAEVNNKHRVHHGVEGDKQLEFRWFDLADILTLDMRPAAIQHALAAGRLPGHFVQRDTVALPALPGA